MAATMKRAPWFLAVIAAGMLGGALTQLLKPQTAWAAAENQLTGNRLVLVDHHGKNRVIIGMSGRNGSEESTFLDLLDKDGNSRLKILVYPGERTPTITFFDHHKHVVKKLP